MEQYSKNIFSVLHLISRIKLDTLTQPLKLFHITKLSLKEAGIYNSQD